MSQTTIIIIIIAITMLIFVSIVLWFMLRKKKISANMIKITPNEKRKDVSVGELSVFNVQGNNLVPSGIPTGKAQASIMVSFGGEQEIKRIIIKKIPANCKVSLTKIDGDVPFSYEFTTDTDLKEFNF